MTTSNNKSQNNHSTQKKQNELFAVIMPILKSIAEVMSNCKKTIVAHKKTSWAVGIGIVVVLLVALLLPAADKSDNRSASFKTPASNQAKVGDYINQRLQDISDQLTTIRSHLSSSGTISLDSLNQQLLNLEGNLKQLSSDSNKLITDEITSSTKQLQGELVQVNAQIKKLEQIERHVQYLKSSDLPFQVIAIDNIQQSDVVTINYNHATFPLEIGGYVATWKLIAADFITQRAEFINTKKQHVVIDLNRVDDMTENKTK